MRLYWKMSIVQIQILRFSLSYIRDHPKNGHILVYIAKILKYGLQSDKILRYYVLVEYSVNLTMYISELIHVNNLREQVTRRMSPGQT